MPCYQEVRSHGRNRREIPMRKDVRFRDTVRDWDTDYDAYSLCNSWGSERWEIHFQPTRKHLLIRLLQLSARLRGRHLSLTQNMVVC
jgi:hypothetical protein